MSTSLMNLPTSDSPDDLSDQRTGNDVELREMVYQSLERDGLIGRLKAQLRAAVFKTIEKAANPTGSNAPLSPGHDSMTNRLCHALVLDWLEQSRLLYTQDVLKVETTGPNHAVPLAHAELIQKLHLGTTPKESRPLLHVLLEKSNTPTMTPTRSDPINSLPDHVKQSIDTQFPGEKINNLNLIREHFRSLFSSAFDSTVLDAYLNKNISTALSSMPKYEYEKICLKWMQACAAASTPAAASPTKQSSPAASAQSLPNRSIVSGSQTTRAQRSTSPPTESSSSSSSSSRSDHPQRGGYDFPLPTTMDTTKNVGKKSTNLAPPQLIDFSPDEDEEEDTSASVLSKRNATPAALNRLKNIEGLGQGDETPRTRTNIQKTSNNGQKETPVEYDDESQSQISSVDDVTIDKASPSPTAHIDFLEDM